MVLIFESLTIYLVTITTAIFIGLYLYFTRNFNFWQKLGVPYVKPTLFVGSLKECVLLKTSMGQKLQEIYTENNDKPYVGIFSFDRPSLLIRDVEFLNNIMVKDFQIFTNHIVSADKKLDPLFANSLPAMRGQIWRYLRTNLTTVFTSSKMKMMCYLVDTCSKELADYLENVTSDGKLFHEKVLT